MSASGRRDELIALVVLLAVAVAIAVGGALSQSGGSDTPDATPSQASAETTPAPSPSASPGPEETGVEVGDQPFVYACGLLPRADVQRIFGTFGPENRVRQQYLERTPTTVELADASTLAYGGLTTECTYAFDDAGGHTLEVFVTQYPSTTLLDRRWTALRKAASRPVSGTDGRMLLLPGSRSFVIRGDTTSTEVRYAGLRDIGRSRPLSSAELAVQVPRMRSALATVEGHLTDGSAVKQPQATAEGRAPTVGGTPYVEPCSVFSDAAFAAIGGAPAGPVVVDQSVLPHDPYANAAVSSCERSGSVRGTGPRTTRSTFAVLEVRTAPDPASAKRVLKDHLANRYPRGTEIVELPTDAGTAYVAEIGATKKWPWRTRSVHVVVGPYELQLAAVRGVSPRRPQGRPVTDEQLAAVVAELAAAVTP